MDSLEIINKIAEKGGLLGECAKLYVNDKEKAERFIYECLEQCSTVLADVYWGEDLIRSIEKYWEERGDSDIPIKYQE